MFPAYHSLQSCTSRSLMCSAQACSSSLIYFCLQSLLFVGVSSYLYTTLGQKSGAAYSSRSLHHFVQRQPHARVPLPCHSTEHDVGNSTSADLTTSSTERPADPCWHVCPNGGNTTVPQLVADGALPPDREGEFSALDAVSTPRRSSPTCFGTECTQQREERRAARPSQSSSSKATMTGRELLREIRRRERAGAAQVLCHPHTVTTAIVRGSPIAQRHRKGPRSVASRCACFSHFYVFFHFLTFLHFSIFLIFVFSCFSHLSFFPTFFPPRCLPGPHRTTPKTSLFPIKNLNFKARIWLRKKEREHNAPTETGPLPQLHAQDLFC